MEKNKIKVRICGIEYTLVSTEDPEYINRVAYLVDKKMSEVMLENKKLSAAQAAVLTSVILADERVKSVESADNLREQLAEYTKLCEEYKQNYLECEKKLAIVKNQLSKYERKTEPFEDDAYSSGYGKSRY